jgi:hypothetical protein
MIISWFSCGVTLAVATKLALEMYEDVEIYYIGITSSHDDNARFINDCEKWFGQKVKKAINKKFPSCDIIDVFEKRKYISGVYGAPCTKELKKEARYQFEKENKIDFHVLGFTVDELKRHERFVKFERGNVIPILIDLNLSKGNCFDILIDAKIRLPEIYKMGFPNANCIGCVKSQSPTYWNLVRKKFPLIYEQRAEQSRRIGAKLVKRKGERIFLDELKTTDKGGKIKSWECGIFCDTE